MTGDLARRINARPNPRGVLYLAGGGTEVLPMLLANGGGSATLLAARIPYAPADFRAILGHDPGSLVTPRAARALAMAAFRHALAIREELPADQVFGLGSTSKLSRGEGEREGRSHEVHAAIQTSTRTLVRSVVLPSGLDRATEEHINALVLLYLIAEAKGVESDPVSAGGWPGSAVLGNPGIDVARPHDAESGVVEYGRPRPPDGGSVAIPGLPGDKPGSGSTSMQQADARSIGLDELESLHDGRRGWVPVDLLGDGKVAPGPGIPPALLLPGSFRPLHEGHVRMAEAASRMLGVPCAYELSLFHPEKPPLDYVAIASRLSGFADVQGRLVFTNAPTYVEKARLFPGATFAIGHDTAQRIIDPRFYGSPAARDAMLDELDSLGTRFLVFGRVDPEGRFRDFSAEEFDHPRVATFLDRSVTSVPESAFRVDLSSTQVRERTGLDLA